MPSRITFECSECDFKPNQYRSYKRHLLTEGHQEHARQRVKVWNDNDKKSAAVVFGLTGLRIKKVLDYFGDLTVLVDLITWPGRPDFCVLQYMNKKFRNDVVASTHIINTNELLLRKRDEIDDIEWKSICYAGISENPPPSQMSMDAVSKNVSEVPKVRIKVEKDSDVEILSEGPAKKPQSRPSQQ